MSELEIERPDDPRLVADPPPIGVLCFVALLAGLFSCLVLANPALIGLSMLAVVFSLIVCIKTELSARKPVGALAGYLGLLLSVFSVTTILFYQQLDRDFLFSTARAKAEEWLALVQRGDIYRSYELTLDTGKRQPMDTDLFAHYLKLRQNPGNKEENDVTIRFYKNVEPEASIRRAGERCRFEFETYLEPMDVRAKTKLYRLHYRVIWDDPERDDWLIELGMQRVEGLPPYGRQWSANYAMAIDPSIERKLPKMIRE